MNARPSTVRPSRPRSARSAASAAMRGTPARPIALSEFAERRARVLAALDGAAAVVFAGEASPSLHGPFRPDADFLYLTGISDEPGAAVVFNPAAENPDYRIVLLLRPLDPEADRWEGLRDTLTAAMRRRLGFSSVLRTSRLPMLIGTAARRAGALACLHPFAGPNSPVSADLALYRKVTERTTGISITDRTQLLPSMRAVKSRGELALMRAAAGATAEGYARALRFLKPGVTEFDVQRELEAGYLAGGADNAAHGSAYDPIVGAGINGAVLHYHANTARCEEGQLVVIDSGARVHGYCCDVTRTLPVSGRFSREQRDLYDLVLKAQRASLNAARAGAYLWQLEAAARRVFADAGEHLLDAFVHSIGHQLGLEVHDATPDGPLKPGMVITLEPGVYFIDRRLGIRIEDSVLITAKGADNLTADIPTSIADIERAMTG